MTLKSDPASNFDQLPWRCLCSWWIELKTCRNCDLSTSNGVHFNSLGASGDELWSSKRTHVFCFYGPTTALSPPEGGRYRLLISYLYYVLSDETIRFDVWFDNLGEITEKWWFSENITFQLREPWCQHLEIWNSVTSYNSLSATNLKWKLAA